MTNGSSSGSSQAEGMLKVLYILLWMGAGLAVVIALSDGFGNDTVEPVPTWSAGVTTESPRAVIEQPGVNLPNECKKAGPIPITCLDGLTLQEREAIQCEEEDGNPDGTPCIFIDPDTRDLYYNDGSNYRN